MKSRRKVLYYFILLLCLFVIVIINSDIKILNAKYTNILPTNNTHQDSYVKEDNIKVISVEASLPKQVEGENNILGESSETQQSETRESESNNEPHSPSPTTAMITLVPTPQYESDHLIIEPISPTPESKSVLSIDSCLDSGGTWEQFANSCADSCVLIQNPKLMCAQVITKNCDCGPNSCWNGNECVGNTPDENISITPRPTDRNLPTPTDITPLSVEMEYVNQVKRLIVLSVITQLNPVQW